VTPIRAKVGRARDPALGEDVHHAALERYHGHGAGSSGILEAAEGDAERPT
jgi:hypothetical protein